jgi:hypothetical protein
MKETFKYLMNCQLGVIHVCFILNMIKRSQTNTEFIKTIVSL